MPTALDASASPATAQGAASEAHPPSSSSASQLSEDRRTYYFRKRLQQALGDEHAVLLQADLPPTYEEASHTHSQRGPAQSHGGGV